MNTSRPQVSIQNGYVLVERPPGYTVLWHEQQAFLRELATMCEEAGYREVLIRGPGTRLALPTIEIFELGEKIARLGLRIAIVESHDASAEDVKFLENVVLNRGAPLQFFDDDEQAKDWLGVP